jgi:pimeloyl-ACP methyl ester carboxylesterase
MSSRLPFIHEFGVPEGRPVVFFHGFPGSHRQPWATTFNLRVLSVDRPGYGFSDPKSGPDLKKFMLNLEAALEKLNVDRFYVVGVSGGNPAAVCTAGHFGDRVVALGSVCGLVPFDEGKEHFREFHRRGLHLARAMPRFMMKPILDNRLKSFHPEKRLEFLMSWLDPSDREVLKDRQTRAVLIESLNMAARQGSHGLVFDLKSFSNPWPVKFDEIRCPHFIWHGQKDRILPWQMSEFLKAKVPHSKLKLYENEGHYSLAMNRVSEILTDLTSVAV